tara:strand:+ start:326 stop:730 length:405 start_codon:yes stop_codon:yes gene_type:complete
MKTELIFFDSIENSMKGTTRGLIAFISLILFDFIWFSLSSKTVYKSVTKKPNIYAAILVYLVICSAIAVQLPKTFNEALVYGLLVGFVIYSVFNLTSYAIFNNWSLSTAIIDTIAGTINCGIAAVMIYLIYFRK